jgi:hypothetical protein
VAYKPQSRCLAPLLSTTFHRLLALPLLPPNSTGSAADDALPLLSPDAKVSIGSRQLSSTLVVQRLAEPTRSAHAVWPVGVFCGSG